MNYEPVIGLEIHCRMSTKTKMFCRCNNNIFNEKPNSHVCPVCMGFPGMLPLINEEAIKKGVKAALALGCGIPEFSKMDRKSYFYPDLPKGYQISQYDLPVSEKGGVTITLPDGSTKDIGVTRLHLEDDAGKLTHTAGGTLVDFNRSGTPLMEIVSEPDIRSMEEASAYARQLQKIVRYVGSSDADMEKGQMRFDLNISLRPKGQEEFGVKSEVKNLNSFRSLEKAIIYEIKRQAELLDNEKEVIQETRGWDDDKEVTVSQRTKEGAADYRYFPEPDIPPITITREMVEELKKEIPELPDVKAQRYQSELSLTSQDANQIASDPLLADYFERVLASFSSVGKGGDAGAVQINARKMNFQGTIEAKGGSGLIGGKGGDVKINTDELTGKPKIDVSGGKSYAKKVANWILSELLALLKVNNIDIADINLSPENLGKMVKLIEDGVITGKIAKDIFVELYQKNADPEKMAAEKGFKVITDSGEIEGVCQSVIDRNPQIVADFKGGKEKAIGGLVGQVMGATKGSANPKMVNEILRKLLKG